MKKHYLIYLFLFFQSISYAQEYQPIQVIDPPSHNDDIGYVMEVDGDWAVVSSGFGRGVFILHKTTNKQWETFKKIDSPDTVQSDGFGTSFDISGNTLAIGAHYATIDTLSYVGSVYIYHKDSGGINNWGLVKQLLPDSLISHNDAWEGVFGRAIAIDDSLLVVSSEIPGVDSIKSVSVYNRDSGGIENWGKVDEFHIVDEDAHFSPTTLAIENNRIVVGDDSDRAYYPQYDVNSGAVYIFDYHTGSNSWKLTKKVPAPNIGDGFLNLFGRSLAIQNNTLVVGAPRNFKRGAAYIYKKDEGGNNNWGYLEELELPYTGNVNINFGQDVAIDGNRILVGADWDYGANGSPGAAYLYEKDIEAGREWGLRDIIKPTGSLSGDRFGYQVGLSDNEMLVTAIGHDDYDGAMYILGTPAYIEAATGVCVGSSTSLTFHFPDSLPAPFEIGLMSGNTLSIHTDLVDGQQLEITPDSTTKYELAWAIDANGDSLQTGLGVWVPVYAYPNAEMEAPEIGCIGDSIELKFRFEFPPGTPLLTIAFSRFHVIYTDGSQDYYVYAKNGQKIKHPFSQTTTYWFKSIINAAGCERTDDFLTGPQEIIAKERPIARFSVDDKKCLGERTYVHFTGITPPNSQYLWDFGPIGYWTPEPSYSVNYGQAGTYPLTLTVVDPNGCADTAYKQAIVHPEPLVWVDVNGFCLGDSTQLNFIGTTVANSQFTWNIDGQVYPTDTQDSHTVRFNEAGIKNVKLLVVNPFGCRDSTDQNFSISNNPRASIRLVNGDIRKLASVNNHFRYQWYKDGEKIPKELGGTKNELVLTETGEYYMEGINSIVCSQFSRTITVTDIILGLFNNQNTPKLSIWPNPTKDKLHIQLPNNISSDIAIKLVDMEGKTVNLTYRTDDLQDQTITLTNLSQYPKGLYILTLNHSKGIWQSRLLLE